MDRSVQFVPGWNPAPLAFAALFALALSPLLTDHVLFHPDERHYVDGGLAMLQTGDWLTPRTGNGELRLQKPVLAYWVAAIGGAVFSPSPFSLRILFLVMGAAVVWQGARIAREATGSTHAASLTAMLLACQPALLISATRSLPDIVLGLFLSVSLGGFVALLSRGRIDRGPLLAAYLGGALAILAKGLPAIVFVLYGTAFLGWAQRTLVRSEWKRLLAAVVLCGLLGGSWFTLMQWQHGSQLAEQFLADQSAAYRFAAEPWQVPWQGCMSLLILLLSFVLPLSTSLRPLYLRRREVADYCRQPVARFLLGWIALFLGCSACINHVSLRYLLPVVVPGAVLLGSLLSSLEGPLMRRNMRGLAWASLLLIPLAGTLLVALRWTTAPGEVLLVLLGTGGVLCWLHSQLKYTSVLRSTTVLTGSLLTCILLLSWSAAVTGGPSLGHRIAHALSVELGDQFATTEVTFVGEPAHAARLRVCTAGQIKVRHLYPHEAATEPPTGLVISDDSWPLSGRSTTTIPSGYDDLTLSGAWTALRDGDLRGYLERHQRAYHIVRVAAPVDYDSRTRVATGTDEVERR